MRITDHIALHYLRKDSPVHDMDALSKLFVVIVISFALYMFQTPWQLALYLLLLFGIALFLVRVEPLTVFFTFAIFIIFGSFVFFFQLLGHPEGNAYLVLGPIRITNWGLYNAGIFLFRMSSIGCAALLYLWTTKPKDFVVGLIKLGVPYRFGFAVLVALRFLPLINDEVRKVRDAHTIRGVPLGSGVSSVAERWMRYLFPVLASGMRKAETAAMAMESRGFGLYSGRSYINPFQWTRSGLALLGFVIVMTIVLGALGGFQYMQPRYDQIIR
ncbi:MAG: energy-coupling factor transporter transmembrane protein EcfT [Chloroflexi bacterium]|nr:energy-coupling factor transporter transmembrane protein EcfT [Chloroflexota bacterium]